MFVFPRGKDYVLRLVRGEDVMECLKKFASDHGPMLASVSGIGAVDACRLGIYSLKDKKYIEKSFEDEFEILSITGNISTKEGEPYVHVHMVVGDREMQVKGGHLDYARIAVTGEIFIKVYEGRLEREQDPEIGINMLVDA